MESLHQDTSLSQQDRHAKMVDIRKATDSQIRELLDSNQQKKWTRCKPSVSNGCRIVAEDRQMRVRASSHRSHS